MTGKRPAFSSFRVEVERALIGNFQEVKLPAVQIAEVEYNYGESKNPPKRPGQLKAGNIELKRGPDPGGVMRAWYAAVQANKPDRRSMTVIEIDDQGREGRRWNAHRCWPSKLLYSAETEQLDEVEIVCESLVQAT